MSNDRTESFGEPGADREPTADEEKAAERAAENLDVDEVGEHYEEMTERGAHQKGEGEIAP